ncbi:MAG TPA: hypothetical protein VGY54_09315 [Polyangiaceae bacterium]|nr:hypothetical protein [Polyangiaceae bacterium]
MAREVGTRPFGPDAATVPEPGTVPAPDVAADPPGVPIPDPATPDPVPELGPELDLPGEAEQATIAHEAHAKNAPRQRR